jgi:hypothetical protein
VTISKTKNAKGKIKPMNDLDQSKSKNMKKNKADITLDKKKELRKIEQKKSKK